MGSDIDAAAPIEAVEGLPPGWSGRCFEDRFGEGGKFVLELTKEGQIKCRLSRWTSKSEKDVRQSLLSAALRWISLYQARQPAESHVESDPFRGGRLVKKSPPRMSTASTCYEFLHVLAGGPLPAAVLKAEDVHKVLALRSAGLIEAETASPTYERGERKIESAQVTAITSAGRAALQRLVSSASSWR